MLSCAVLQLSCAVLCSPVLSCGVLCCPAVISPTPPAGGRPAGRVLVSADDDDDDDDSRAKLVYTKDKQTLLLQSFLPSFEEYFTTSCKNTL